jgi:invasion protein IalB
MDDRNISAPAGPAIRAVAVALASTMLAAVAGSAAVAQTPPAPKAAPPAPPAQPKQPPKAAPAAQPKAAPAPAEAQQGGEQPQLIFSPWTKFCLQGPEQGAKKVCFTGKDGRVETGMPVIAAVLIEPEGEPRKILRVTLPLGMSLQPGTRVIVDQGQPMNAPYVICFNNGCMADYEASGELIDKLKKGQGLVVQGINGGGQPVSLVLPLADFAKAYNGPPTDPKEVEKRQKEFSDRLQESAKKAREELESRQPQAQAPTR